MALIGYTALSVLRTMQRRTPLSIAARMTFSAPLDVRAHRLHRIELAGRHLLQRRCMENVIGAPQRIVHAVVLADITDVELQLVVPQPDPHVLLLLLVTAEDADLGEVRLQEVLEHRIAERSGAPRDDQYLVFEHSVVPLKECLPSPTRMHASSGRGPATTAAHIRSPRRKRVESSDRSITTVSSGAISFERPYSAAASRSRSYFAIGAAETW